MKLSRVKLSHFRNIERIDFEPGDSLNILYGDNGQGKTSLIEGIFFLSHLRSFRTPKNSDLIKFGAEASQIEASVENSGKFVDLKARLLPSKKALHLNDKNVSSNKFIGGIRSVVFSPESLLAIKSGPDLRRQLIDQAVFQLWIEGAQAQIDFSRALKQRNACLKMIKSEQMDANKGRAILESLEQPFVNLASDVIFHRLKLLNEITPLMMDIYEKITGDGVSISLTCTSSEELWKDSEYSKIRDRLQSEIQDITRSKTEEFVGVSLTGPHRHDISILFNENDSRIFCSQGQQRALILAFKIAEIVYHGKAFDSLPLLLLDDVLSELDDKKKTFLLEFLTSSKAQTFLTTTDKTQQVPGSSNYRIETGQLISQKGANLWN